MAPQSILVTGGAGYIGSHTVLQLLLGGYKAIVVDNLDNSSEISINRVKELAGDFGPNLSFHHVSFSFLQPLIFCVTYLEVIKIVIFYWFSFIYVADLFIEIKRFNFVIFCTLFFFKKQNLLFWNF